MEKNVDVAIVGAGSAGLHATTEVRRVTDNFVVIDGGTLGTTCARVGCMPSKVLLQIADDFHRRHSFDAEGIVGGAELTLDAEHAMDHVRSLRDRFVSSVMDNSIDALGDKLIREFAEFCEPDLLIAGDHRIRAEKVIIATGSTPTIPKPWRRFSDRIETTDSIFELTTLPARIAVLGLGAIGLELGQALSRMGVDVAGFDALDRIGGIEDPEVNRLAIDLLGREMPLHLGAMAEIEEEGKDLRVTADGTSTIVDKLLVCVGRTPNLAGLNLRRAGVALDDDGVPHFDPETRQIADLPIFIAGDADDERALLHEASHEGRAAGYNAVHEPVERFRRQAPLTIAFTDPNICAVGETWEQVKNRDVITGEARFDTGRAIVMLKDEGLIRVYADGSDGKLLGAALVAPRGEHLAHLLAWSIHKKMTVFDVLEMPFYHPVIEETLQAALNDMADALTEKRRTPFSLALV